jgi:hypothetical protein
MLDVLDLPGVNRVLVLNAGGHGDTLDDVVSSFKSTGVQQAVLSKIDEAAKLGPALDAAEDHRLLHAAVPLNDEVLDDDGTRGGRLGGGGTGTRGGQSQHEQRHTHPPPGAHRSSQVR